MKQSKHTQTSTRYRNVGLALAALACAASLWYFSRSPVQLDADGYDLTIALYRVCNQRDADALQEIESRLSEMAAAQPQGDHQREALDEVIREARQGNWRDAMITCRTLLDDQVHY
ncbi:hypothetical protein Enr13x_78900 [Stieleria neptunia]|uniref:Uncharacterized protein n=1 Tax=Stieleria neptunia TaxID=2527979 RepID=A0A518I4I4_9BACT|nr:hypothetical protein [Stieleria neptunia]QDV47977.1 hypothetical protein Enr13x_78900 [Stieleria neptunia]